MRSGKSDEAAPRTDEACSAPGRMVVRHDHVAGKKRRVPLLHLTVVTCFRANQTSPVGHHGPHWDEGHLSIVVDDTPIESRVDSRDPAERRR